MSKFTSNEGPWHYCGRCEDRVPIARLRWQRGILLDEKCFDKALVGDIDKAVAQALMALIDSPDLAVDPKLTQPEQSNGYDDIFI